MNEVGGPFNHLPFIDPVLFIEGAGEKKWATGGQCRALLMRACNSSSVLMTSAVPEDYSGGGGGTLEISDAH